MYSFHFHCGSLSVKVTDPKPSFDFNCKIKIITYEAKPKYNFLQCTYIRSHKFTNGLGGEKLRISVKIGHRGYAQIVLKERENCCRSKAQRLNF